MYYGECCCEKEHQSVGKSCTTGNGKKETGFKCLTSRSNNCKRCKTCRPFFSRHYLDVYGSNSSSSNSNTQQKKPVLLFLTGGAYIIGYKMWGTLLARALSPNILVIVPDYRNYPRVTIQGMVEDVDRSIEWVLKNVEEWGGDRERVVVVGQSAGGHLGGICLMRRVLRMIQRWRSKNCQSGVMNRCTKEEFETSTGYKATDLCGFISTSSPHNMVSMKHVFHKHGLSKSVQRSIFGGTNNNNDLDVNGEHVFEKWSTFHLVKRCQEEYTAMMENDTVVGSNTSEDGSFTLKDLFPQMCVIHGTNDKTVSAHNLN